MSTNAIAPSTSLVSATSNGEENFDFSLSASNAASRQAKGTTRERHMLNRQKLISSVCADFRSHFAAIYGKTDRLPSEVFDKVERAVDELLAKLLGQVNATNAISFRRAFHHNGNQMKVTERVVTTGENEITLKEQLLGITLFIGAAEKRLKDLEAKKTPDYEREKEVKQQIMKLTVTKSFIEGELKHQEKLAAETPKA